MMQTLKHRTGPDSVLEEEDHIIGGQVLLQRDKYLM